MGRSLAVLAAASLLPIVAVNPAHAAVTEIEDNGSSDTATVLKLNTEYSGTSYNQDYWDEDYFAVDIPSAGRTKIDFKFPANLGTERAYNFEVLNFDGDALYELEVPASANNGSWLAAQGTFFPKGRSYIKVSGSSGDKTWGKKYTLNVSHTPGNAESEFNDDDGKANVLKLGTTYSASSLTSSGSDDDYYAVDIPSNGRTKLDLKFPANLGTREAYEVFVYNVDGEEQYLFDVPANASDGSFLASQGTFMPKGRAYIRVRGSDSWETWGKTYSLNVSHAAGVVETEPNNSTSAADLIKLGTTYSGSILRGGTGDEDFYALDIPYSGRTKLDFKFPANLGTQTAYNITVMDDSEENLYSFAVPGNAHNGTWLASQAMYLPKGRIYIQIDGPWYGNSLGKTYTLGASHSSGNVETEFNQDTATANAIKLGTTYSGSSLSAEGSDYDYFAVNMPSAGRISLDLKYPAGLSGYGSYDVDVFNGEDDRIFDFDLKPNHANGVWLAGQPISLPKGRSYISIAGSSSDGTWGKTYTLKATAAFTSVPTPTITGTAKAGATLKANAGTWKPGPVALKYQWKRDGKAISKATKSTYKLTTADTGKKIAVTITGAKTGYKTVSKTSTAKTVALLALSGTPTPTITGTAKAGATLKANAGTWKPGPVALKYQWKRDGKAISKATKSTYKLTTADTGKKIAVTITGAKTGYKTVSKTSTAKTVALLALSGTPTPTITGTAKAGATLKANAGTWKPGPVALKYQWKRDGKAISKATKSTYKLTTADRRKKITVTISGAKAGYKTVAKTSASKTIAK
ncbi:hypothetical protein [Paeniglutamicibacter sp. Y32M11]|uniref:hypothetical protein n=1 Tax=Paeniglutamicibacter sp. Y32M11 TaxID=2853258 RepID=UPI001C530AF8|nr:hypothetical protein [Paeniglutamicibacter sp. Y32M11]QXQ09008.1 hypothetical protein KUF55_10795 [Paeniglutamicibacter sp. Y32M11]